LVCDSTNDGGCGALTERGHCGKGEDNHDDADAPKATKHVDLLWKYECPTAAMKKAAPEESFRCG
jgi:hypothetical protein